MAHILIVLVYINLLPMHDKDVYIVQYFAQILPFTKAVCITASRNLVHA